MTDQMVENRLRLPGYVFSSVEKKQDAGWLSKQGVGNNKDESCQKKEKERKRTETHPWMA